MLSFNNSEKQGKELLQEIESKNPNFEKIKKLIFRGADISFSDELAAKKGLLNVIECMHERHPNRNKWGKILYTAIDNNHADVAKFLVDKEVPANYAPDGYVSAPVLAMRKGMKDLVQTFMNMKAYGSKDLEEMIDNRYDFNLFKMIIDTITDQKTKENAFLFAARWGTAQHIAYLLDHCGVDLAEWGGTALDAAVHRSNIGTVQELLQRKTPMHGNVIEQIFRYSDFDKEPQNAAILELLIHHNANIHYTHYGRDFLFSAAQHKSEKAVEILWKNGLKFEDAISYAFKNSNEKEQRFLQFCEKKLTGKMTPVTKEDFCLADLFEQSAKKDKVIEELAATLKTVQAELATLKAAQNLNPLKE